MVALTALLARVVSGWGGAADAGRSTLQQRHIDVVMSTVNGLRYAPDNQPNREFLA
ncbi:hypothetical protein [Saccharothrix sp. ALI-22-I]|uniref:hypothetical protein n=1 Tax=Saccharothrix sp. ALI-22-I TaxID=1933778 RepID=UPI0015C3396E|nr:hypothetical protein [Saccharothrix sp. ALI-22-I]